MSHIPPELYERVHELALAITNAVMAGDEVLSDIHRQRLRDYHDEQVDMGRSHPFLLQDLR